MCKSRVLVNYRYIDKMSEADKYALDLKIQQAISKLMFGYVSQKQISDFSIGDNDYIEDLISSADRNDEDSQFLLETMRKYQKVEQIMKKEYHLTDMSDCLVQRLVDIRKVLEDGNDV